MRTEFIPVKSYNTAKRRAPWASIIAKAENGFFAFECVNEYKRWKGQK